MNWKLMMLLKRLHNEAGTDGSDAGGTDVVETPAPAPAPAEDRGDVVDPGVTAESLAALVGEGENAVGEGEGGAEGAAEGDEPGADGGQGGKPAGIPTGRFNEVNQKRKDAENALAAAEAEIARLKAGAAASAPAAAGAAGATAEAAPVAAFDEEIQEEAFVAALLEGDSKKAAEIRRGINAHLRSEAANTALQRAEELRQAEQQKVIAQALQAESVLAVEKYPYLDTPEGAEALELIVAARDAKVAKGVPAHEALRAAVASIAPRFAPADGGAAAAPAAATPAKDVPGADNKPDSRTSAAIARGAAASIAQPPALNGGVGDRATAGRISVEKLTDEQFDQLSDAEKKRLRGD